MELDSIMDSKSIGRRGPATIGLENRFFFQPSVSAAWFVQGTKTTRAEYFLNGTPATMLPARTTANVFEYLIRTLDIPRRLYRFSIKLP